jgi:adenylate kinase family enzyme
MSHPQRVQVIGSSGAGKTTFARRLATRLRVPHIEIDSLFWGPNWSEPNRDEFRDQIRDHLEGDNWVIDGNYRFLRQVIWTQADAVVFLDYPFWLSFGRLLRRTGQRIVGRQELWGSNRETLRDTFLSDDSILWYTIRTHRRKRRQNLADLRNPAYAHLDAFVFRSPREAHAWLDGLPEA